MVFLRNKLYFAFMKIHVPVLSFFLWFVPFGLVAQDRYLYTADVKNIVDDKVTVTLQTPTIKEDVAVFSFPKAIPGSYSEKDFGRFIFNLRAYDAKGRKLPVDKINNSQFKISKAKQLKSIRYQVGDTWDQPHPNFVFQPGGTNIEAGKNVVVNNHAFFGYFDGYNKLPFEVTFTKPAAFHASTHLPVQKKSAEQDQVKAKDYAYLADNPIIYCIPDTTSFTTGKSRINVSVYSASGKVTSSQVAGYLKPMTDALSTFFNGLPVTSYQFLYFFDDPAKALTDDKEGGYGALEHNYSSLYYLPEIAMESRLRTLVNEVSSHEFLHIQTPLNLHSREIEDFDFINPVMSQHLWLYEGVTEYFAHLVQLQSGLLSEEEFIKNMREKMEQAEVFGAFSMTEMSRKVLTEEYKSKYNSVYNKGALVAFMLDLFIRDKTGNVKDLKSVVQTLSAQYGPNKPFNDSTFFDEFVAASHPEVEGFVEDYIKGSKTLPYDQLFANIGFEYDKAKRQTLYKIGEKLSLIYNEPTKQFVFQEVGNNALDIKEGDVLTSIEGEKVNEESLNNLWEKYIQTNTDHGELTIVVNRNGSAKVLTGKLFKGVALIKHYIAPLQTMSDSQKQNWERLRAS